MVLGEFKFTRGGISDYDACYRGPIDSDFQRLCVLTRASQISEFKSADPRKWVGIGGSVMTGPHRTRLGAASAFLGLVCSQEAAFVEQETQNGWDNLLREGLTPRGQPLSHAVAADIYDILVQHARANIGDRRYFALRQSTVTPDSPKIDEWRFGGLLGYGGKFWNVNDKWYVTAYPEDTTDEIRRIIAGTNLALLELFRRLFGSNSGTPA